MKAVWDGEIEMSEAFVEEMYFCLDCQACETACPAGVKYGTLVESARAQIVIERKDSVVARMLRWLLLHKLLGTSDGQKFSRAVLRFFQKSGVKSFLSRTRLLAVMPGKLRQLFKLLPSIQIRSSNKLALESSKSSVFSPIRVGFLTGCIMDMMFRDVNADTILLLEHHGCEVVIPEGQSCCGSLQAHSGDMAAARQLAAKNVRTFARQDLDAIVMNSAGCGAFMKRYGTLFSDDPELAQTASAVAAKTKDLSEFLAGIGLDVNGSSRRYAAGKRVTYHDACHLVHAQKVSEQPRKLIKAVPDVQFFELPESTWCCGSAGVYNITHTETADQLLERKMASIRKINPDIIVTSNPGCLLQIQVGVEKYRMQTEILHLATFLRRACCG